MESSKLRSSILNLLQNIQINPSIPETIYVHPQLAQAEYMATLLSILSDPSIPKTLKMSAALLLSHQLKTSSRERANDEEIDYCRQLLSIMQGQCDHSIRKESKRIVRFLLSENAFLRFYFNDDSFKITKTQGVLYFFLPIAESISYWPPLIRTPIFNGNLDFQCEKVKCLNRVMKFYEADQSLKNRYLLMKILWKMIRSDNYQLAKFVRSRYSALVLDTAYSTDSQLDEPSLLADAAKDSTAFYCLHSKKWATRVASILITNINGVILRRSIFGNFQEEDKENTSFREAVLSPYFHKMISHLWVPVPLKLLHFQLQNLNLLISNSFSSLEQYYDILGAFLPTLLVLVDKQDKQTSSAKSNSLVLSMWSKMFGMLTEDNKTIDRAAYYLNCMQNLLFSTKQIDIYRGLQLLNYLITQRIFIGKQICLQRFHEISQALANLLSGQTAHRFTIYSIINVLLNQQNSRIHSILSRQLKYKCYIGLIQERGENKVKSAKAFAVLFNNFAGQKLDFAIDIVAVITASVEIFSSHTQMYPLMTAIEKIVKRVRLTQNESQLCLLEISKLLKIFSSKYHILKQMAQTAFHILTQLQEEIPQQLELVLMTTITDSSQNQQMKQAILRPLGFAIFQKTKTISDLFKIFFVRMIESWNNQQFTPYQEYEQNFMVEYVKKAFGKIDWMNSCQLQPIINVLQVELKTIKNVNYLQHQQFSGREYNSKYYQILAGGKMNKFVKLLRLLNNIFINCRHIKEIAPYSSRIQAIILSLIEAKFKQSVNDIILKLVEDYLRINLQLLFSFEKTLPTMIYYFLVLNIGRSSEFSILARCLCRLLQHKQHQFELFNNKKINIIEVSLDFILNLHKHSNYKCQRQDQLKRQQNSREIQAGNDAERNAGIKTKANNFKHHPDYQLLMVRFLETRKDKRAAFHQTINKFSSSELKNIESYVGLSIRL